MRPAAIGSLIDIMLGAAGDACVASRPWEL